MITLRIRDKRFLHNCAYWGGFIFAVSWLILGACAMCPKTPAGGGLLFRHPPYALVATVWLGPFIIAALTIFVRRAFVVRIENPFKRARA